MNQLETVKFEKAVPVWMSGAESEKNITVSAVARLDRCEGEVILRIAASSSYVVMVNGELIAHGPARCAHGFYRVDELDLNGRLENETNYVAIRAVGYNVNSFAYLEVPSFVCAEILQGSCVLAYTAEDGKGFEYYHTNERVQKVQRYSFQRPFVESYRLEHGAFEYEFSDFKGSKCKIENTSAKTFIKRHAPYGDYELLKPHLIGRGTVEYSEKESYFSDRAIKDIGEKLHGYTEDELEDRSYVDTGMMDFSPVSRFDDHAEILSVPKDTYALLEFDRNFAGIFTFDLETDGGTLYFTFDEIMTNDGREVNEFRMDCSNVIKWQAKPGNYHITCAEPYTLKYLRIIAKDGNMAVSDLVMHKIAYPSSKITKKLKSSDKRIQLIYDAAVETFAANTVDIYMDCPSRERAGWLCDSFFTSRVEHLLTGKSDVERDFLENFILPDSFKLLPKGMLPMCYPADHADGTFIPNWAMWYVIELSEYLDRTGDREFVNRAREKVYALLEYFKGLENEYGLLESLKSWVFIEWSKANSLTQDVNFPSNMLYAGFKSAIAKIYGDDALNKEADELKKVIREMSMTESGFFCDNALRVDGKLLLSGERTEVCQYYAFFFGIADKDSHGELLNKLLNDFGFERRKNNKYPDIYFANAFIGNYMRLEIIERLGLKDVLLENILSYFTYMAESTGTLWENETSHASCNHGFASLVAYWLDKIGLCE